MRFVFWLWDTTTDDRRQHQKRKREGKRGKISFVSRSARDVRREWQSIVRRHATMTDDIDSKIKRGPNQNHDIRLAILFILIIVCVPC